MRRWFRRGAVAGLAAALLVAAPAYAEEGKILVDQPPHQVLGTLRAGESIVWRVGMHLEGADSASLDLQLRTWGALVERAEGLLVQVDVCEQQHDVCSRRIIDRAPLREVATRTSSDTWHVTRLRGPAPVYLDVELSLPAGATGVADLEGSVGLGLVASGDGRAPTDDPDDDPGEDPDEDPGDRPDEGPDPEDDLPVTGIALGSLLALAVGLTLLGGALRATGRRTR